MSGMPKYWEVVHKDDQQMERAPKDPASHFLEGIAFFMAAMYIAAFLSFLYLHGSEWKYSLTEVTLTPAVLIIVGLFARHRRAKKDMERDSFYQGGGTNG